MNPTDFQTARDSIVKSFETKYADLKRQYCSALKNAKSETDRPRQCVLIKSALDTNGALTTLVSDFLRLNDEGACSLSPDRIHKLQSDIEKYKDQFAEIQQGRDKVFSLEKSFADIDSQTIHADGVNLFYFVLTALCLFVLIGLVFSSGISSGFNAQPVSPVVPRGFA